MSSIAISFDGLVPLLALIYGALGYGVIAVVAAIRASMRPDHAPSAWLLARRAGLMSVATMLGALLLLAGWAGTSTTPRTGLQLDHLLWPWLVIFCFGCLALTRAPRP